jgi:hypothetical protein
MNVMFVGFVKLTMIPLVVGLPARIAWAQTDVTKAVHEKVSTAVSKCRVPAVRTLRAIAAPSRQVRVAYCCAWKRTMTNSVRRAYGWRSDERGD